DLCAMAEQDRLQWLARNQNVLRPETIRAKAQYLQKIASKYDMSSGSVVILPASHPGSKRWHNARFHEAMAICRVMGKPDLFITFTCNPRWSEITANIPPGLSVHDRPDIVSRVFRLKVRELLDDLLERHVLGYVQALVLSQEYQKRGL